MVIHFEKFRFSLSVNFFQTHSQALVNGSESVEGGTDRSMFRLKLILTRMSERRSLITKDVLQHTPSTTHLTAWFCQDPLFFGSVAVLLWLHFCVCVCPLVHPLCSSVPQTATTTQYHSVWTLNGSPSSRATHLVRCFMQVSDMVFTTRHN